jgi:ubiquinone/menaquinone biosynthesis C-methylase UbiE
MTTAPDGYEGRIGRYTRELADALIAVAGVRAGQRALDVGCGGGALTEPLAGLLGTEQVVAVDPSPAAVGACRARLPGVDVRLGSAEALPCEDDEFDAVLAQLVVTLLADAERGVAEMRRVARPGAPVATCVWDFGDGMTVLRAFWDAARALDRGAAEHDQASTRPNSTLEDLHALWVAAGLRDVSAAALVVGADYHDFDDDLWPPLVSPDGPPGRYYAGLDPQHGDDLRRDVRERLGHPRGPFRLTARAWCAVGYA